MQYRVLYCRSCLWRGHHESYCPFVRRRNEDRAHEALEGPQAEALGTPAAHLERPRQNDGRSQ
jgi:hypothetical protein